MEIWIKLFNLELVWNFEMHEMKLFLFICLSYLFADDVMHPQAPIIPEIQALTSNEKVLLM